MVNTQTEITHEVTTQDWTIRYCESGTGHPLILLHGSGPGATGWSNFSSNIEALAKHFRVFALDLPGWGGSSPCTKEKLDHIGAVIQFMDALKIGKAAIVGNSMGGILALALVAEHPDRVSHVITMGPAADPMPKLFSAGDGPSEGLKVLQRAYLTPTPESMRELVNIMVFDKSFATDELCQIRSDAAQACPEHLANFLDMLSKGGPVTRFASLKVLAKSTVPALLIHGRDDRVLSFEHSLLLNACIPNSRLVLLNRCGHWAMIEHADEFNRLVTDFVINN